MNRQPTLPSVPEKPRRQMLKPRKAQLYADVDRLTDENARKEIEIARLAAENQQLRQARWWAGIFRSKS